MKAKLKFDTAAMKDFVNSHWEKFVLAVSIVVLLLFVKSIFTTETLPAQFQPTQISLKSNRAEENVNSSRPDPSKIAPIEITSVNNPIDPLRYDPPAPIIQPIFLAQSKRTDPNLLPVIALQATGLRGGLVTGGTGPGIAMNPVPDARSSRNPYSRRLHGPTESQLRGDPSAPSALKDTSVPGGAAAGRPARGSRSPIPPAGPAAIGPGLFARPAVAGEDAGGKTIPPGLELPGAPGGGSAEGRYFVIVTGAVPVEQQQREYNLRFSHAQRAAIEANPGGVRGREAQTEPDAPQYICWRLERTDLTAGGDPVVIDFADPLLIAADWQSESIGSKLVLNSLKPKAWGRLKKDQDTWQGAAMAEVVPEEYLGGSWLSSPLPPILLHDWGREATNPQIPLVPPQLDAAAATADPNADPATTPAVKPGDDPFGGKDASAPDAVRSPRGVAQPGIVARGFDPYAPGRRVHPRSDRSAPSRYAPSQAVPDPDHVAKVPYKLFRFVDFEVEPGHSYQYRAQLVLKNPNFGMPVEVLMKPDPKPAPYRDTPWSELSRPATVPSDTQLVAEGVDRPKRGEAKAKAGILLWDKKDAVELLAKADLELGAVANFVKKKVEDVVDPVQLSRHDFTADFTTNGALLDMRGGEEKEKDKAESGEPAELLFLIVGKEGKPDQLVIVNQVSDKPVIVGWEKTHKVPPDLDTAAEAVPATSPGSRPFTRSEPSSPGGGLFPAPAKGPAKTDKKAR